MFRSAALCILAVAAGVSAKFPLAITQPLNKEFVTLGEFHNVTIHADVSSYTRSVPIQLTLCREISGPSPPCNATSGRVIFNASFRPPEETYNVLFPADQIGGLTRLIASRKKGSTVTGETEIEIFLGSRA